MTMPSVITSLRLMLYIVALAPSALAAPTPRAIDLNVRAPGQKISPPPPANQNTAKAPSDALVVSNKAATSATTTTTIPSATPSATTKPPAAVEPNGLPAAGGTSGPDIVSEDNSSDCALNRGGCNLEPRSADKPATDGIPPLPVFETEDDNSDSSQNRGGSDVTGE